MIRRRREGEELERVKLFSEIPFLEDERIVLKRVEDSDAQELERMASDPKVYRYLPTFLYEQNGGDAHKVIRDFYDRLFPRKEAVLLGVYRKVGRKPEFCGLAELYGYREDILKISMGYRLMEEYWGQGLATRTVALLVDYLYGRTDIEIITASTMPENQASARVLRKNGFIMTSSRVPEDWGYEEMTPADKWFR